MTHFPDLGAASMLGAGENLRAVGWLSPDHPYPQGDVSPEELDTLNRHLADAFQPGVFMGSHQCEFCGRHAGQLNLVVPTGEVVYVAPEMILHYITEHGYRPPDRFFDALRACPRQGSPEYMRLFLNFRTYFGLTEPSPAPTDEQREQIALLIERGLSDIHKMCRSGDVRGARAMADALTQLTGALHGWGLWYRHLFARVVRNSREECPVLTEYLNDYNDVFGEDTDQDRDGENGGE